MIDRFENIRDLHEEVLKIFLEYKEENSSNLTFLLRSPNNSRNKGYLNKGKWFMEGKNNLYTIFLKDEQDKHALFLSIDINNLQKFKLKDDEIWHDFESFLFTSNSANLSSLRFVSSRDNNSKYFLIELNDINFATGLKKILKLIDEYIQSELNLFEILGLKPETSHRPIPQDEFQTNLDYILQKRKELKDKLETGFPYDVINRGEKPEKIFITDFIIENYYAVKSVQIQNLPKEAPWIFLTGENGAGKSLLLQGLAIGLYGNQEEAIIPKNEETLIQLTYQSKAGDVYKNNIETLDDFKSLKNLACFGPIRLDILAEGSENKSTKRSTATYGIFGNYDALLKNIETELKFAFYENKQKYSILVAMLKKVIPSLHEVEFDKHNRVINYIEKGTKKGEEIYNAVSFSELATGVKSIIAMVGDIYIRFSTLMQKGVKTDEYLAPEALYGIVIIDEIDLHLHPKWQKSLPSVLSAVFPNIQFIASTHSAIPILGAPKNSVLLRVNRNKEDGITVERLEHLEKQLKDLTPNLILTSEIFGFQDIFPVTHDKSERIRTEDTMEELEENDEMMAALKSYMNTDKEEELLKLFSK